MMMSAEERRTYWDAYYATQKDLILLRPSQFAVFVSGEIGENACVLDFGCGNGRDSLYLSYLGHSVIGIDASRTAIEKCLYSNAQGHLNAKFFCSTVEQFDTRAAIQESNSGNVVIYARFFLHAVTDEEEKQFFTTIASIASDTLTLCLEFRTLRDADRKKETHTHYRRFLDPYAVMSAVIASGFSIAYFIEGFGYAKYKDDDAYVARIIAAKK